MTWKSWDSGPMTSLNWVNEPGQSWISNNAIASGRGDRTCTKWTCCPSISVVNCGNSFNLASMARQSYVWAQ